MFIYFTKVFLSAYKELWILPGKDRQPFEFLWSVLIFKHHKYMRYNLNLNLLSIVYKLASGYVSIDSMPG